MRRFAPEPTDEHGKRARAPASWRGAARARELDVRCDLAVRHRASRGVLGRGLARQRRAARRGRARGGARDRLDADAIAARRRREAATAEDAAAPRARQRTTRATRGRGVVSKRWPSRGACFESARAEGCGRPSRVELTCAFSLSRLISARRQVRSLQNRESVANLKRAQKVIDTWLVDSCRRRQSHLLAKQIATKRYEFAKKKVSSPFPSPFARHRPIEVISSESSRAFPPSFDQRPATAPSASATSAADVVGFGLRSARAAEASARRRSVKTARAAGRRRARRRPTRLARRVAARRAPSRHAPVSAQYPATQNRSCVQLPFVPPPVRVELASASRPGARRPSRSKYPRASRAASPLGAGRAVAERRRPPSRAVHTNGSRPRRERHGANTRPNPRCRPRRPRRRRRRRRPSRRRPGKEKRLFSLFSVFPTKSARAAGPRRARRRRTARAPSCGSPSRSGASVSRRSCAWAPPVSRRLHGRLGICHDSRPRSRMTADSAVAATGVVDLGPRRRRASARTSSRFSRAESRNRLERIVLVVVTGRRDAAAFSENAPRGIPPRGGKEREAARAAAAGVTSPAPRAGRRRTGPSAPRGTRRSRRRPGTAEAPVREQSACRRRHPERSPGGNTLFCPPGVTAPEGPSPPSPPRARHGGPACRESCPRTSTGPSARAC